jgi:hypothetical protein
MSNMASSQMTGDNVYPDDSVSQVNFDAVEIEEEDLYGDQGTSQSMASVSVLSQLVSTPSTRGNLFYVNNQHDQREAETLLKVFPLLLLSLIIVFLARRFLLAICKDDQVAILEKLGRSSGSYSRLSSVCLQGMSNTGCTPWQESTEDNNYPQAALRIMSSFERLLAESRFWHALHSQQVL